MKISIITVCFNSAATIQDTIFSVASQDYTDIEHIIIDGASSDETVHIIQSAKSVTKFVSEPDQGIYDAMNKGLALATGEVIGFLNADDMYADDTVLSRVAKEFEDDLVDATYANLVYVDPSNTEKVVRYWQSCSFAPGFFKKGWMPAHPTFFARKNVYERFGGFDESYRIAADLELMMRFLEVHKVRSKYIPHLLVKMRMGGTTNQSLWNIIKQNREILDAFRKHHLKVSVSSFLGGKLLSRIKQFISRPVKHAAR